MAVLGATTFSPTGDLSPLSDLAYGVGQILADSQSDQLFLAADDLLANHEELVGRIVADLYAIDAIDRAHDARADAGLEAPANLAANIPVWDELAQPLGDLAGRPGAITALVASLGNSALVTPNGSSAHLGNALATLLRNRDRSEYNQHGTHYDGTAGGINGPPVNLTVDPSGNDPAATIKPQPGWCGATKSATALASLHGRGTRYNGPPSAAKIGSVTLQWPITGFPVYASPYGECAFSRWTHSPRSTPTRSCRRATPKRSTLSIEASDLNALMSFLGVFVSEDTLLTESSDIAGFTSQPTTDALNRFLFFGASSANFPNIPDLDSVNAASQVNSFVSDLIEPVSDVQCPPDMSSVPSCADESGVLRVSDYGAAFGLEPVGIGPFVEPVVEAAADVTCDVSPCTAGEGDLTQALSVLAYHWPGPDHGAECTDGHPRRPRRVFRRSAESL